LVVEVHIIWLDMAPPLAASRIGGVWFAKPQAADLWEGALNVR
jgi:hypothetical protein